jgi:hypothetical protein
MREATPGSYPTTLMAGHVAISGTKETFLLFATGLFPVVDKISQLDIWKYPLIPDFPIY